MKKLTLAFLLLTSCCTATGLQAQSLTLPASVEIGLPLIRNYSPREYQAHPDVWSIIQDDRGVMYFSCGNGVLEYDGVTWRLIRMKAGSTVYALAQGNDGRIYAGGQGDFGFLAPDSVGQMRFVSLLDKVVEQERKFNEVNSIAIMDEGVLFQSLERLFLFAGDTIRVLHPETSFGYVIQVGNQVFIRQNRLGLMHLIGDSLRFIPGGERLASSVILDILPYPQTEDTGNDRMLILTVNEGLLEFDGSALHPAMPDAAALLASIIYRGALCPGAEPLFALASLGNGVAIVNAEGKIIRHFNKGSGLISSQVNGLYFDRQNALWLATQNGISRLELFSPHSVYDERLGFPGSLQKIFRFGGVLHLLEESGAVFALTLSPDPVQGASASLVRPRFQRVAQVSTEWDLYPFGDSWLTAKHGTVFQVRDGTAKPICQVRSVVTVFHRSQIDTNRVYVGDFMGLYSIRRLSGRDGSEKWINEGAIEGIQEPISRIIEAPNGDLWLETDGSYPVYAAFDPSPPADLPASERPKARIEHYSPGDGLPQGDVLVYPSASHPVFATEKGLYRFVEENNRFVPDSTFGGVFYDGSARAELFVEDSRDNAWVTMSEAFESVLHISRPQADGRYEITKTPFLSVGKILAIFPEDNGVAWVAGTERLLRYDSNIQDGLAPDYPALIRSVMVNGDSVIFGGTRNMDFALTDGSEGDSAAKVEKMKIAAREIAYAFNTVRFRYAAPGYGEEPATRYQYYLEGFDRDWSDWTDETMKEYTNLPPGDFKFRVRARNVHNHVGSEASYSVHILPPWYRSNWANGIYLVALVGLLLMVRKFELNRLGRRHQQELEHVEYEKLRELDRLKSRFFTNITHEFRTPLTLILGPLDGMLEKSQDSRSKRNLGMMRRHAHHLLRLINQLLDLSKLESGKLELQTSCADVIPAVRGITAGFESMAKKKRIDLQFHSDLDSLALYFDQDKLEKILHNLLANAIKFTDKRGKISVTVARLPQEAYGSDSAEGDSEGVAKISVKDTGIGIAKDKLPFVFDRFYQAAESGAQRPSDSTRAYEGTGIGLSLAKELVELHHGSIEVRSQKAWGTEAIVRFRLGRAHLRDDEIVELSHAERAGEEFLETIDDPDTTEVMTESDRFHEVLNQGEEQGTILVVEDNVDMRIYIHQHLEQRYRVIEAPDGEKGVAKAIDLIPDLIVSDVIMPTMDGYALCQTLKADERTCHIPIILLTAKAAAEEKLEGLGARADAYLVKPFDAKELLAQIKNLIALRQVLQEKYASFRLPELTPALENKLDQAFMQRMHKVIEEHLDDERFGVEELAQKLNYSRTQLHRKTSAITNRPVSQFIRSVRLHHARQMLEQDELNISEVAFRVGFSSHAYFSKCFREEFGSTPKQFLKAHRGD